jgi:hypothetical protein
MTAFFDNMPSGVALAVSRRHNQPAKNGKINLPSMRMTGEGQINRSRYYGEDIRIMREGESRIMAW